MKLPIKQTLQSSFDYLINNKKTTSIFMSSNFLLMLLSDFCGGWTSPTFFLFLLLAYVLWVVFFRLYFNKKPYFDIHSTIHSLNPSIRIMLLMCVFAAVLIFLPYIFIFMGLPIDYFEQYMDKSKGTDIVVTTLFILFSPIILYRPYFAWIASAIDKNLNISKALKQTKGNYFRFLFIFALINVIVCISDLFIPINWITHLITSVIFTYFNIVLAKSYEFFFKV